MQEICTHHEDNGPNSYNFLDYITWNIFHYAVELVLVITLLKLLFGKRYLQDSSITLTDDEIQEICDNWKPEQLVSKYDTANLVQRTEHIITLVDGIFITVDNIQAINFSSFDFLGMLSEKNILDASSDIIQSRGVGSCGPRGFYGTFDVHLELEDSLAKYMKREAAVVYSYDVATAQSIIPSFLKRGDIIIRDQALNYALQTGIEISKADVEIFNHNDVEHLESILEKINTTQAQKFRKKMNRRFIVIEGIYQNTGTLCPLNEILQLAKHYKYRLILDESMSIGVLGENGRGACEHYGIESNDISIICGSLSTSFASIGGFVVSNNEIASHQRLSSAGYCFSASLPPFNATAANCAIQLIFSCNQRTHKVQNNAIYLQHQLQECLLAKNNLFFLLADEMSPIKHLHLQQTTGDRQMDENILNMICDLVLINSKFALVVADYSPLQLNAPRASIRITVTSSHSHEHISALCLAVCQAAELVGTSEHFMNEQL